MTTPVKIADADAYVGYAKKVDEGNSAETHLAYFNFPDAVEESQRAVVKFYPATSCGWINEIIGFCMGKALGLPQPQHAAVFPLPIDELPSKPTWIPTEATEWPAFATTYIPKKSIKPWFDKIKGDRENPPDKKTRKAWRTISTDLNRWTRSSLTCAFDHWIGNRDRNIGNLIRMKAGDYRVVDHGQIFGDSPWTLTPPGLLSAWPNKLQWMLEQRKNPDAIRQAMFHASKDFEANMATQINEVLELLDEDISPTAQQFVRDFLSRRASEEYLRKYYGMLL